MKETGICTYCKHEKAVGGMRISWFSGMGQEMSKFILVIDTPETCLDCKFCREIQEGIEACCELSDGSNDKEL